MHNQTPGHLHSARDIDDSSKVGLRTNVSTGAEVRISSYSLPTLGPDTTNSGGPPKNIGDKV